MPRTTKALWQRASKSTTGSALRSIRSLGGPLGFEPVPHSFTERYRPVPRAGRGPLGRRERRPLIDVYLPRHQGPRPATLLVHGGGFVIGHRRMKPMRLIASHLVAAGHAVAVFDYRLLGRGTDLHAAVDDVVAAGAWFAGQATRFKLDLERFGSCGLSAGGALMLLAAPHMPQLQSMVSVFGLYDFADMQGVGRAFSRLAAGRRPHELSPKNQQVPVPLTLLHGTADTLVGYRQAEALLAQRQAAGLPTRLRPFEGARHAFMNEVDSADARAGLDAILDGLEDPPC